MNEKQLAQTTLLKAGERIGDPNFASTMTNPLNMVVRTVAGAMVAGGPLATWGNNAFECEFDTVKPAHTIPILSHA